MADQTPSTVTMFPNVATTTQARYLRENISLFTDYLKMEYGDYDFNVYVRALSLPKAQWECPWRADHLVGGK